jgi:hypothetical protein
MARRKTTLYLDDELLRAAAERAARTGRAAYRELDAYRAKRAKAM